MDDNTITFLDGKHGFEVGVWICVDGRTAVVAARDGDTVTLRWPRWYERAWRWLTRWIR